jgi:hypothetical protein
MARWAASSPPMSNGTTSTWMTKSREMMSSAGNSPPKIQNAATGPASGIDRVIDQMMRSPVADSRSSGNE